MNITVNKATNRAHFWFIDRLFLYLHGFLLSPFLRQRFRKTGKSRNTRLKPMHRQPTHYWSNILVLHVISFKLSSYSVLNRHLQISRQKMLFTGSPIHHSITTWEARSRWLHQNSEEVTHPETAIGRWCANQISAYSEATNVVYAFRCKSTLRLLGTPRPGAWISGDGDNDDDDD